MIPALLFLVGCEWFEPALDPLTTEPMVVQAEHAWELSTDARQPTDLLAGPDGWAVLDGYQGRLLRYGFDRAPRAPVSLDHLPFRPVRVAPAADGADLWITAPTSPAVVRIDPTGRIRSTLTVFDTDGPVLGVADVVDRGDTLVVALAEGAIARVDAASGAVEKRQVVDYDGGRLGAPVHLAARGGEYVLTDAFGAAIHRFDEDLTPVGRAGRHGMWIGTVGKPKATVVGPDGVLVVADSEQGAVEVFDPWGRPLGVIATDDGPLRIPHPIAVARVGDEIGVLDARTGTVHGVRLTGDDVDDARSAVDTWRFLRTDLVVVPHEERLADGSLCHQCHDGAVLDDRQNWDPDLHHHPVHVAPSRDVPGFFPLDDGAMRCTTCHSPHGTVTVADATDGGPRGELVRHAPSDGDQFTRLSRDDAALCVACHTDAAHERALGEVALAGSAHPTGEALERALAERGQGAVGLPGDVGDSCLTCHDVHAAERSPLLRPSTSSEVCAACHRVEATPGTNHPLHGDASLSDGCRSCHDLVGGTSPSLLGGTCTSCHTPLSGGHGRVEGTCTGCHDVHDAPAGRHLVSRAAAPNDAAGCTSCHEGHGGAGHPVTADVGCSDCHDAHAPADVPTCLSCHDTHEAPTARGGHGSATCLSCHPAHEARPTHARADVNPRSARCLSCHAPDASGTAPRVPAWEHPAPVFTTEGLRWTPLASLPLFDATGEPAPPAHNGDLTCSTCHTTHGPPEAGGPLLRPDVPEACASCHGEDAPRLHRTFHAEATP